MNHKTTRLVTLSCYCMSLPCGLGLARVITSCRSDKFTTLSLCIGKTLGTKFFEELAKNKIFAVKTFADCLIVSLPKGAMSSNFMIGCCQCSTVVLICTNGCERSYFFVKLFWCWHKQAQWCAYCPLGIALTSQQQQSTNHNFKIYWLWWSYIVYKSLWCLWP